MTRRRGGGQKNTYVPYLRPYVRSTVVVKVAWIRHVVIVVVTRTRKSQEKKQTTITYR